MAEALLALKPVAPAAAGAGRDRPLRIGLDACCFIGTRTGIPNYVEALLRPLCAQHPDVAFHLFSNDDGDFPSAPNLVRRVSFPRRRGPVWHNTQLVGMLEEEQIDVFWGTNGQLPFLPLQGPKRTASVVTVHDLVHRFAPQTQRPNIRWKQRLFQPLSVRVADRVVAVSKATAADVARHYGRVPDAVIEPLAQPVFGPVDAAARDATLARLGLAKPYLLMVGTLEPRKNMLALIEAYAACTAEGVALPPLVVVGGQGWHDERLQATLGDPRLAARVRWLGYQAAGTLAHLYAGCHAFIMPSLYEGYGMPLLEAQLCRAPVVHGAHASMAEAAGGVGVAVSPHPDALRRMLRELAAGALPLASRLPSAMRNDADESAQRFWQVMTAAWAARSRRRAGQLA